MKDIRIFIVTYHKDYVWLDYLLKSIEKYTHGFSGVTIVADDDEKIPDKTLSSIKSIPLDIFYVKRPDEKPISMSKRHGYMWQQCIKFNWWKYCKEDYCVQMDSDCIFRSELTPEDLQYDNKFVWHFQSWDSMKNKVWKPSTDSILRTETLYQGMIGRTFVLTRNCTKKFIEHITEDIADNWGWHWFIDKDISECADYCLYGGFIKHIHDDENYYCKVWDSVGSFHRSDIAKKTTKYRSYDGITEDIRLEYEKYLS